MLTPATRSIASWERGLVRLSLIVVVAALGMLGSPATAQDDTAQPDCDRTVAPTASIQDVIDEAAGGEVICLEAGTWETTLSVEKSVTLRGQGPERTVVKGTSEYEGVTVLDISGVDLVQDDTSREDAPEVSIQGLAVVGGDRGISAGGHATVTISDVHLHGHGAVGLFAGKSDVTVQDATITGYVGGVIPPSMPGHLTIENTVIKWTTIGLFVRRYSRLIKLSDISVRQSTMSNNWVAGVVIQDSPEEIILTGNSIQDNRVYGVMLMEKPCAEAEEIELGDETYKRTFSGRLSGHANTIPGPNASNGNGAGAVCPDELEFLMTEKGGELDR